MKLLLLLSLFFLQTSTTVTLTVKVKGIPNDKGNVMVGVYNDAKNFSHPIKVYKSKIVDAKKGEVSFSMAFKKGEKIALALYHDENKNQVLDKNMFGVPTEVYGFSNDARGTFSAPSFEEAEIVMDGSKGVEVTLE
ncbi:Uncharacterized conserved protein, DUF2141 family [Lishizhenia tianjinensis]|uniref:Uncharacterized conserved protein, DUF2141 family n=1 Tax=Lishizhenia tianjinensis TaxID=477690 RepID=A0A1I7BAI4_9FLAO|nr:DUF2141 domain-containing protein [Lishizhenia tianjinensis]SFT84138.1 Uncharacterized conserved protein, DUF2141 family [Lishizhenia tianjinensis]